MESAMLRGDHGSRVNSPRNRVTQQVGQTDARTNEGLKTKNLDMKECGATYS